MADCLTSPQDMMSTELVGGTDSERKAILRWARGLNYCPRISLFLTFGIVGVFGWQVSVHIQVDGALPPVFPDDHNQAAGKTHMTEFDKVLETAWSTASQHIWICDAATPLLPAEIGCVDKSRDCPAWGGTMNQCVEFTSFMEAYCPRSCGLCEACLVRWCNVPEAPKRTADTGTCHCFQVQNAFPPKGPTETARGPPKPSSSAPSGSAGVAYHFHASFIGLGHKTLSSERQALEDWTFARALEVIPEGRKTLSEWSSFAAYEQQPQPALVQEHWRSGSSTVWPMVDLPALTIKVGDQGAAQVSSNLSEVRVITQRCYCGGAATPCENSGERVEGLSLRAGGVNDSVSALAPPGSPSRRLTDSSSSTTTGLAVVSVIYGIRVQGPGPFELFAETRSDQAWSFDFDFHPEDPWAQRSMMKMSAGATGIGGLQLKSDGQAGPTWLVAFEEWLDKGGREGFPSRTFSIHIGQFLNNQPGYRKFFLAEPSGAIRAAYIDFALQGVASAASFERFKREMQRWDEYVTAMNAKANFNAHGAWHTSHSWVQAQAVAGIISSTGVCIFISVIAGFFALLAFTRDIVIATLSVVSVTSVVVVQLFFMVMVMQWLIGPVEAVALIVFIGYIFTFNLHIAHAYCHTGHSSTGTSPSKARLDRTVQALHSRGCSILGSSLTTVGCACFLLICEIRFFIKFGAVILSVTALSTLFALGVLPMAFIVFGPTKLCCGLVDHDFQRRCRGEALRVNNSDDNQGTTSISEEWLSQQVVPREDAEGQITPPNTAGPPEHVLCLEDVAIESGDEFRVSRPHEATWANTTARYVAASPDRGAGPESNVLQLAESELEDSSDQAGGVCTPVSRLVMFSLRDESSHLPEDDAIIQEAADRDQRILRW